MPIMQNLECPCAVGAWAGGAGFHVGQVLSFYISRCKAAPQHQPVSTCASVIFLHFSRQQQQPQLPQHATVAWRMFGFYMLSSYFYAYYAYYISCMLCLLCPLYKLCHYILWNLFFMNIMQIMQYFGSVQLVRGHGPDAVFLCAHMGPTRNCSAREMHFLGTRENRKETTDI